MPEEDGAIVGDSANTKGDHQREIHDSIKDKMHHPSAEDSAGQSQFISFQESASEFKRTV